MNEIRVKICGLTCLEDARAAVEFGADYLGLVFARSPRQVSPAEVSEWLDELREDAEIVGVFRDATFAEVEEISQELDLDLVQLHGEEQGEQWERLPVRFIEARAVAGTSVAPARFSGAAWAELLDTASAAGGGSGQRFDWSVAASLSRSRRLFVAGGLRPENVAAAIAIARPFAVDVSSGIEATPGRKDVEAMRRFIQAARGQEIA